jgi:signal transduction histidine kinase
MIPVDFPALRYVAPAGSSDESAVFSPEEQQVLDRINQKIAAQESLEQLVDFLFDAVQPILVADRIGVSFLEEDGARLVAHYTKASYEPLLLTKGYAEDLNGSSLETVLRSGRPRIIDDLERYLANHPSSASTRLLVREGVRASMTCPLVVDGRIAGMLFFSATRPHAYTEHHVRLHQAMAERLSQAVEKASRIEQLAQANKAYFEMLGFVSHELKSPLASIMADVSVLDGGYLGEMAPEQRVRLGRMRTKADYLLNLIREYLDLARIEGGELTIHPKASVDLVKDIVEPACDIVAPQADEKKMRVERKHPDQPALATCDPDLLKIVAVNFLGNAVKYGRDGGIVRVSVERAPDRFAVAVWNEGPGFPASQRGGLFRRFSRLDTPELRKRKGTGVGLYTSWRIVRLHGGRVGATSQEGAWAEFTFTVPQPLPSPEPGAQTPRES